MNQRSSPNRIIFFLVAAAIVMPALCGVTDAKEKRPADENCTSRVVLLTNEELFPALLSAIDHARKEIFISMFSFKAGVHQNSYADRIAAGLGRAAKRGVNVSVILENTGNLYDDLDIQNKQTGKWLAAQGIRVYYDAPRKTTHTKMIVIDENIVIVGSHNFTQSGLKHNNEVSVLLENSHIARQARDYMFNIIQAGK
jgi:phosphatidylserine/phosphatidylglycerophosphate/cardiolipin synthase-like enzyme